MSSSNNQNFGEESSNFISFNQRMRDFTEYQNRLSQENNRVDEIIQEYIFQNPSLIQEPKAHVPRKKREYIDRNRDESQKRLFKDYFAENPVYSEDTFRRRFRMQKHVFLRLSESVSSTDPFFQQKNDATGKPGFTSLQKCTAAIRVLAYGSASDVIDEYLRMSESVTRQCVIQFVEGVINNFGDEYLRKPNQEDLSRLLQKGEERGFPGMLGSIDCMHWYWKNCPTGWQGIYAGRSGKPTIILEAVASYDTWIWHAFFGTPGSLNDINVLHRSPVFEDVLEGRAPPVNFVVNGNEYNMGYYLTDGIYPKWAAFVKTIQSPVLQKHKLFAQHQESARKDVERAFGVLQARFAFIRKPSLIWDDRVMGKIMKACIIMHNMIVEDERHTYLRFDPRIEFSENVSDNDENNGFIHQTSIGEYLRNKSDIEDRVKHEALKKDLVEHIWQMFGHNT